MENKVPNYAKPEGKEGEDLLDEMDREHTPIALWSYTNMTINDSDILLDIGCGSGLNVKRLHEKSSKAKSYGVDYSSVSVKKSKQLNKKLVEKEEIEIIEADVQNLPFSDDSIDIATAFSTIFFWPNIVNCFKEVKRVLRPGGKFYIIQGLNGVSTSEQLEEQKAEGCMFYDDKQLKDFLFEAGYSKVIAFIRKREKNKKLIKTSTSGKTSEELVDDLFDERTENEHEPVSQEWLCVMGEK